MPYATAADGVKLYYEETGAYFTPTERRLPNGIIDDPIMTNNRQLNSTRQVLTL